MTEKEIYRKLQTHLHTFPVGFPKDESGVDIRLLEQLFTQTEAKIALELSFIPAPKIYLLPKLLKIIPNPEEIDSVLEKMYKKGLIKTAVMAGHASYSLNQYAIGFFEYQVNRMSPEFARDTVTYIEKGTMSEELVSTKIPQMRTIPINKSITIENKIATYDQAEFLIINHPGPFAVANCVCRQTHDLINKPCQQTTVRETCLLFGSAAEHWVDIGIARTISQEDSLLLLEKAQKDGLVLQPTNTLVPLAICCCCGCCCGLLKSAKKMPKPVEAFASNYYANINSKDCIGCKLCMKKCHMEAIEYQDKKCIIDTHRCIGCGACVPICPKKALSLKDKTVKSIPYKNITQLYISILKKKAGLRGVTKVVAKAMWLQFRMSLLKKNKLKQ